MAKKSVYEFEPKPPKPPKPGIEQTSVAPSSDFTAGAKLPKAPTKKNTGNSGKYPFIPKYSLFED